MIDCCPVPILNLDLRRLSVGGVGPAGLLGAIGCLAVVDRPGVQQSGPAVELELKLLRRTCEE